VEVGHGDGECLLDEDEEDEVLVGVGAEVALVVTEAAEEGASGEVVVVVEVSEGVADSGVHSAQHRADFNVYMSKSRFERLDLARDSSKSIYPLVHHGDRLQKPHEHTVSMHESLFDLRIWRAGVYW